MTDRNSDASLPNRPGSGTGKSLYVNADDKIIVDVMGTQYHMDPVVAMSLAGAIIATVEVYMRNKA